MAKITTENYLKDLVKQKQALVDSLNTYGVEASTNEKFNTLVPKVEEVYEAGKAGGSGGYDEGYEAGQKAEYDRFWDNYQDYGNRTSYTNGFGSCWSLENFKPKYDIKPTDAYMLFRYAKLDDIDLVEYLDSLGVTLDFSNCTNAQYAFYGTRVSRLGVIDLRKCTGSLASSVFGSAYIETIDLLKIGEGNTNLSWFAEAKALKNLTVEGVIVADLKVDVCPLTHTSLMSIINALKDFGLATIDLGNALSSCYSIRNNTLGEYVYLNEGESLTLNVTHGNNSANGVFFGGNIENNDFVFLEIVGEPAAFLAGLEVKTITIRYGEYIESEGQPTYNATIVYKSAEATQSKTLTIGADNLAKLTDEEKKKATDKGWILA